MSASINIVSTHNQPKYILYLYVDNTNGTLQEYKDQVLKHNERLETDPYPDSGFDLYVPEEQLMYVDRSNKIDFKIKCEMKRLDDDVQNTWNPSAFYLYPRSSISKTRFRLSNNVGIIDSGYRGNIMGMFDIIYSHGILKCGKLTRLLQICTPTLEPFKIVLCESDATMSNTSRGQGGFGSTGGVASV